MRAARIFLSAIIFLAGLVMDCGVSSLAGNSAETGNARITGTLVDSSGRPAAHTQVTLVPASYDPVNGIALSADKFDTTDRLGVYTFTSKDTGKFNIQAVQLDSGTRVLVKGVRLEKDSVQPRVDTLQKPGRIKAVLTESMSTTNGYLYIQGSTIYSLLDVNSGFAVLDSVPSGTVPAVYYTQKDNPAQLKIIRDSIAVVSGMVSVIAYSGWKYSKKCCLNTTASGANVPVNVLDFPVLIRLNAADFNFAQAQPNGDDIRCAKSDGTSLSFEIEQWDASLGSAALWIKVDTVFGNDSSHFINLCWGNTDATAASNSPAVFDTAAGFQGVWHLNETWGLPANDATGNHYDGTAFNAGSISPVNGMVGVAQRLDGQSGYFQMIGTSSSKLNFPRNGTYAISAWAYADTIDNQFRTIASKGDFQYNLEVIKEGYWEFAEFGDKTGWDQTTNPAVSKTWVYLMGVRAGPNQYLYFNGNLSDSTIGILPDTTNIRNTGIDFMIGRIRKSLTDTISYSYKGIIDEVRMSSNAPSADWIKLCYMNQRADDKLVKFK
jgi:hypothetical protein